MDFWRELCLYFDYVLRALGASGAHDRRRTGSGAGCFAITDAFRTAVIRNLATIRASTRSRRCDAGQAWRLSDWSRRWREIAETYREPLDGADLMMPMEPEGIRIRLSSLRHSQPVSPTRSDRLTVLTISLKASETILLQRLRLAGAANLIAVDHYDLNLREFDEIQTRVLHRRKHGGAAVSATA